MARAGVRPGLEDLQRVSRFDAARIESIGPKGLVRFTARDSRESRIGVVRRGRLVWSRTEQELFGEGFSTGGGWTFDEDPASGTYVGSVGPDVDLGDKLPLNRSVVSFAIRQSTGAVVWRRPGVDLFCDRDFTGRPADPFIACRWTSGTATVERPRSPVRDAAYVLERIDPRTGRARWTADPGKPAMATWGSPDLGVGSGFAVAPGEGGVKVVRLDTGSTRAATSTDVSWRDDDLRFEGDVPFRARYQTTFERQGVLDEQLVAGTPAPGVRLPLPDAIGVRLDGLAILAVEGRVLAFRPLRR